MNSKEQLAEFQKYEPRIRIRDDVEIADAPFLAETSQALMPLTTARPNDAKYNAVSAEIQRMSRRGLVLEVGERTRGTAWKERIEIRTPDLANRILSLSGGNQQKVLFARALATRAPIVLMDDPMRGVDVGTKQEVYAIIREEAARGRTFIWYSTEMEEVCLCDRVYVFREGRITAELVGDAVNEANIISASFEGAA